MKNSLVLTGATALAAFGTGGEAVQALRMKTNSMFQINNDCEETAEPPKCCTFDGGLLDVFGSNALTPGAYYFEPSRAMDEGIQVAIDEINDHCGIELDGKKYALRYARVDDQSDADIARLIAAQHLNVTLDAKGAVTSATPVPDTTAFYVAPYATSQCETVNPVVAASGKASIAPGCSTQSVYTGNANVFGVRVPAVDLMLPTIDAYAALNVQSIVSVVEESGFPQAVCSPVKDKAEALKISFLGETSLKTSNQATDAEIDNMVNNWKAQGAEFVVGCTYEDLCIRIIQSMVKNDFNPQALAFTECVGVKSATNALGKLLTGVTGSLPFPTLGASSATGLAADGIKDHTEFEAAYKLKTGQQEVPIQAAASYAGVKIMADAIQHVNSTNGAKVAAHLYSHAMPTAFGDFRFDATGQPTNKALVMQYDADMKARIIYPLDKRADSKHAALFPKPKWAALADGAGAAGSDSGSTTGTGSDTSSGSTTGTGSDTSSALTTGTGSDSNAGSGSGGAGGSGGSGSASGSGSPETSSLASTINLVAEQRDYTNVIVGSVVGGLFMLGAMVIAALFAYAYLFRARFRQQGQN